MLLFSTFPTVWIVLGILFTLLLIIYIIGAASAGGAVIITKVVQCSKDTADPAPGVSNDQQTPSKTIEQTVKSSDHVLNTTK